MSARFGFQSSLSAFFLAERRQTDSFSRINIVFVRARALYKCREQNNAPAINVSTFARIFIAAERY